MLNLITPDIAQFYNIIPIRRNDDVLTIAMADPLAINTIDDLKEYLREFASRAESIDFTFPSYEVRQLPR